MTGLTSIGIKFGAFALVSLLLGALLLNTMLNGVPGSNRTFKAMFTDVSGLSQGDDVRVAGVRVGRVAKIAIAPGGGAEVQFQVEDQQPVLSTTHVIMRYQNLLGQRYLSLEQRGPQGSPLHAGATIPKKLTSPGFDLTELLNGFRPLFDILNPADVNQLANSLVKVLQGEGGSVESLLQQTSKLTNFVADRDKVYGDVLTNLTPVLKDIAGQGTELHSTVTELKLLMTGLAEDRQSIGNSIDGVSNLIVSTSDLLAQARAPLSDTTHQLRTVAQMLAVNRGVVVKALRSFGTVFESLGRPTSYQSQLNVYLCTVWVTGAGLQLNLAGGQGGPWSKVCQ
jgi:phospholipid/cholesterol/gamma-HCH transport system substrate-binding protein